MTTKRQKLELEVLKSRDEKNAEKLSEAVKQLTLKYGSSDPVVKLLENEAQAEKFFVEHEISPDNVHIALGSFPNVIKNLSSILHSNAEESMVNLFVETSLLLAKIQYAQDNLSSCIKLYDDVNLQSLLSPRPRVYMLRMLAEAFAIKAHCTERMSHKVSPKGKVEQSMHIYEQASNCLLMYLAGREKMFPSSQQGGVHDELLISSIVETAVQRVAVGYIRNKELWKGVAFLRHFVEVLQSHPSNLRQVLACRLATILLRSVTSVNYRSVDSRDNSPTTAQYPSLPGHNTSDKKSEVTSSGADDAPGFSSLAYPVTSVQTKPKFFLGEKAFSPSTVEQEVILLIRISEAMLNMDPVLDMSPEHASSRQQTLLNAEFLYNLLCIVLVPLEQYALLSTCIENSLKYAFDHFNLWQQFALSLSTAGKFERSIQSFWECCRIDLDNPLPALMAAKSCYQQQPPRIDEGLNFSRFAVGCTKDDPDSSDGLKSRAYLCLGVGMALKALKSASKDDRVEWRFEAIQAYTVAHTSDSQDHKPCLYLALEFAQDRKISQAFKKVRQALERNPEDLDSLHLLALLQTSRKQYNEAKITLQSTLLMYPKSLSLLTTKCKLELYLNEEAEALRTCDEIMKLWAAIPSKNMPTSDIPPADAISMTNRSIGTELDAESTFANSIAASRWNQTASDLGSFSELPPRLSRLWSAHSQVWLQAAEIYLALNRADEADMCTTEAGQLYPLSPYVMLMRGQLHQYRNELTEASVAYNNVLAIDPFNLKAMEALAGILRCVGKQSYAKKLLQDAIKLDITSHTIWQQLAEILESEGDVDGAIEATSLALKLESTAPVVPFSSCIPLEV